MSPTASFSIEVATSADLPAILDLVGTEYSYPYNSAAYWQWRYSENPAAEVAIYVARGEGGQVVAMQPVSAYMMAIGGEVHDVHLFTAAITHPQYRRRGLFRQLIERIVADLGQRSDFFIFTFPNELSVRGFRQFAGWKQRESLSLYVRPLSLLSWLHPKNATPGDIEARLVAAPERVGDLILSQASHFEEDTLPLLHSAFSANVAYVRRNQEYLEWRYPGNPTGKYFVQQARRDDELVGYIVVKMSQRYGLRAGLIVDLVARDNQVAHMLLRRVIRTSRQHRSQALAYLVGRFNPYRSALLRAGLFPLPNNWTPRRFCLYVYPGGGSSGSLGKIIGESPWYVTWGDTDVI